MFTHVKIFTGMGEVGGGSGLKFEQKLFVLWEHRSYSERGEGQGEGERSV